MISDNEAQKLNEQEKRELIYEYFLRISEYNRNKDIFAQLQIFTVLVFIVCFPLQRIDISLIPTILFFVVYFLSLPRLPVSEEQIDSWIEKDKDKLLDETRELLEIKSSDEIRGSDGKPFLIWSAVDLEFVKIKYEQSELFQLQEPPEFIPSEDYFAEAGIDRKKRFGVYSFGSIFVTETSLAYVKCYWNFVRGAAIDLDYGDYVYASIASVGYKEDSASSQKPGIKQIILQCFLRFTSHDARQTTFVKYGPFSVKYCDGNFMNTEYEPSTELKKIQLALRSWVRLKRVDYQRIRMDDQI